MEKPDSRQAEMDARHHEAISWRNTARAEDKQWRETLRQEDKAWRESARDEDKEWRQVVRDEDKMWRTHLRKEDNANRARGEREHVRKRCCALTAAVQSLKPGTPPEVVFELAETYEKWLDN